MAELSPKEKEFMALVYKYAKKYVESGWAVLPVHCIKENGQCTCGEWECPQAGKHPRNEKGTNGASKDLAQIEKWFGENAPLSNIGIACGSESGLSVLDLDVKPDSNGVENYLNFADLAGQKPNAFKTLSVETGSGGRHLYFKFNSVLVGETNAFAKECIGGKSGIDIRTKGNMAVAPPSKHKSGGVYKWLSEKPSKTPILDFPEFLLDKIFIKRGGVIQKKNKPTLDELRKLLEKIPADDRDIWMKVFLACGRAYTAKEERDEVFKICSEWAAKSKKNDAVAKEKQSDFFYIDSQDPKRKNPVEIASVVYWARENGFNERLSGEEESSPLNDYIFAQYSNQCVYLPNGEEHSPEGVNRRFAGWMLKNGYKKKKAVDLIAENCTVTSRTYAPKMKNRINFGFDSKGGEVIPKPEGCLFNEYEPPPDLGGDARKAMPWVRFVFRLMPRRGDAKQFIRYLAHRVQRPWEKPRYALLIGGEQGIGKDTAIGACTPAWGYCNEANIDPNQILTGFNEYAQSVLVRVNEAGDLKDGTRWELYNSAKVLIAGNPDSQTVNPKYGKKYSIMLCCGVIFTTNNLNAGAIFLDRDDRRFDVIQCATAAELGLETKEKKAAFFKKFYGWLKEGGGFAHVQAYLKSVNISKFEPAVHRVSQAHKDLVQAANMADDWFLSVIDALSKDCGLQTDEYPKVLSFGVVKAYAEQAGEKVAFAKKSFVNLSKAGFKRLHDKKTRDGRFSIDGKKHSLWILDDAGFDEKAARAWLAERPQILEMPHRIGGAGVDNGSPPWQD